jgi:hypothetical protein
MLKDRMVRVKLLKHYREQRALSYVGKVKTQSEGWIVLEAKGVMVGRNLPGGAQVDAQAAPVLVPRDNIESIAVLPDTFDLNAIQVAIEGQQIRLVVKGGADCLLGEMGEG